MSYFIDDDSSQIRELKDKLEKLQSDFLSSQFSVQQENVESGQSIFPIANPSARPSGSGSGSGSSTIENVQLGQVGLATVNIDLGTGTQRNYIMELTGDISIAFTNLPVNTITHPFEMTIEQTGTAYDVTFPVSVLNTIDLSSPNTTYTVIMQTYDGGTTYVAFVGGSRISSGGGGDNLGNHIATQDIDFATFDGKSIDRLLYDQAAGSSIAAAQTGTTSDAAKNLISHVPTGSSHIIQVNGSNIVIVNSTSILAPDILPSGVDDIGSTLLPWNDLIANQLSLQAVTAPGSPNNGEVWYDTALNKFRVRENGSTIDMVGGGSEVFVWTANHDANGNTLILDADGDSSISSASDDSIQIAVNAASELSVTPGFVTVPNSLIINGNTTLGNASTDIITANARFATALVPSVDNVSDLGINTTNRWRDLWLSRNASVLGTLITGGTATFLANVQLGDASTDTVTVNAQIASSLIPDTDNTYDLGVNTTGRWRDLWLSRNLSVIGTGIFGGFVTMLDGMSVALTATFDGDVILGSDDGDDIEVNGEFISNLIPNSDNLYDLGESGKEWRDIYIDGELHVDTITNAVGQNINVERDLDLGNNIMIDWATSSSNVGSSGSADALPTPFAYVPVRINGTEYRLAVFNKP